MGLKLRHKTKQTKHKVEGKSFFFFFALFIQGYRLTMLLLLPTIDQATEAGCEKDPYSLSDRTQEGALELNL